ncbi:tRNA uridine-5-carboxymethylaminomethyl(34) synthesis GTPase MnmE [Anaeromicropila herbilytica]|uniref:tRNA modification GTPase MnmE n=1 Tax=Anaeromicropila herbilytica TaxID=2785025 RepID=A0A7R7IGE9_9FIRM|nr:tRNA uridine-5-carboxymethylaminomethyl(34) synthesis GTPase MnmE [Anaeromicropila herbilytica]BCN33023.1 tRNA modification GTPase MnmE [Anaeromicropila herbilytica]
MNTDTIAAIATAVSNAGISIIRISGEDALSIIDRIYLSKGGKKKISEVNSHTVHYGYIIENSQVVDEALVLIMKGPNSYTAEDVVEIQCHGGVVVTKRILDIVIKQGARPAEPGEFTKRAFLNGRIDLSQAEAVMDVINAKNDYALKSSIKQLQGNLLSKINEIRKNIIRDIAFIEAALDDPEHISLDNFSEELLTHVSESKIILEKLLSSSDEGRILKEGINTAIIGKPNAGKSSLLNVLLGEERAIVTDIAGTTRDTLEESINIAGIGLNIIDTAGIRKTSDIVEQIGVSKAKKWIEEADLVIYVVDASSELDVNDRDIISLIENKKAIILLNKIDLNIKVKEEEIRNITGKDVISISAKEKLGIDQFKDTIMHMFFTGNIDFNDEIYITNARHKQAIQESLDSLEQVVRSIKDQMPEDFYSIDLMSAYERLGTIIGESIEDDLVNTIFSEFCMGK